MIPPARLSYSFFTCFLTGSHNIPYANLCFVCDKQKQGEIKQKQGEIGQKRQQIGHFVATKDDIPPPEFTKKKQVRCENFFGTAKSRKFEKTFSKGRD